MWELDTFQHGRHAVLKEQEFIMCQRRKKDSESFIHLEASFSWPKPIESAWPAPYSDGGRGSDEIGRCVTGLQHTAGFMEKARVVHESRRGCRLPQQLDFKTYPTVT